MSGLTENHKHVRRRLEPLRMAVWPPVSAATPRANGPRVCVTEVEVFGVRYRGRMIFDAAMDWSCGGKKPYLANRFVEECVRLSQLRHPHLTTLYGIVIDGPSLTLATDLPVASLDEYLCRYKSIPEFMKNSILLDAARGLLYLHKQSPAIAHTRVSTQSVYVTSAMSAKIGDVGVAGALGEAAAEGDAARNTTPSNARMPPQTFVKLLETGTKCTDTTVDVPAFGNVIVHTACHRRWLDPPGHTTISPYLHTMPGHHPLYSIAYHCLLGGIQFNTYKQVPQVDMDYVVECLQHIAKNDPSSFHNTLELFQALSSVAIEQKIKQSQDNHTTSPHQHNFPVQEHPQQDGHIQVPNHKNTQDRSSTLSPPPTSGSSSASPLPTTFISSPKKSSSNTDFHDSAHHVAPPLQSDDHYCSRHNSTGQVRAPPPKPPQRSSSFRRKKSEQVAAQDSLQRTGSLRLKKTPTVEPILPSSNQQQTSPVIKVNVSGVFSGGSTKQNSLLLPSKFSPVPHKEEHSSRGYRTEQDGRHTSFPTSVQPSPHPKSVPSNTSEFERLLARQREKVESDQPVTIYSQPPPLPSTNGGIMSSLEGMKAATDMDLPKKKAPKPPRRTSSFKSYIKPAKYEKYSNNANTSELMFRRHNTAPQLPPETDSGKLADCLSSSSTSPSTGQSRLSSVE